METTTFKKWHSKTKKHFRDFTGMALQIMAFNLATDGTQHGSSSFLNSIGFVLLRILLERKNKERVKKHNPSEFVTKTFNILQKAKTKSYGHSQPKV